MMTTPTTSAVAARTTIPAALIVGASSGIGAALARTLARRGYHVALLARRQDHLDALCADLNAQGAEVARAYVYDVRDYEDAPALFERIRAELAPATLRMVVYNAGILPTGAADSWTFAEERAVIETNLLGAMRWLDLAAEHFSAAREGVLVGVSSVAGERGRRGASAYQASKAAFSVYLESLRYRLGPLGVRVVTVKPGYVETAMTAGKPLPKPLIYPVGAAAERIATAAERGVAVTYVPGYWGPIMWVVRHLPSALMRRLPE